MAVDQAGENVVFVIHDGMVEAHIQIQYEGDAERFAWVIPVPTEPTLSIGSEGLFIELQNSTVPTFELESVRVSCGGMSSSGGGCGMAAEDGDTLAAFSSGVEVQSDGEVTLQQESVGAFEYSIVGGEDPNEVLDWLDNNGFLAGESGRPVLAEYAGRGHKFVALELRPGAQVQEIHPIVLRYPGDEACIPIKLTRIAATDDMGIRAFFLSNSRVVPNNFRHVTLNPVRFDWNALGQNYNNVVSVAVDSEGADAHGFVTEYAGPSSVVDRGRIAQPMWYADTFADIRPETLTDELTAQGLLDCQFGSCAPASSVVAGLLEKYLPPPTELEPALFYSCSSCYAHWIEEGSWQVTAFTEAIETRYFTPAREAAELLREWPYLTRMFTTISPAEMTKDPMFSEWELYLPEVSNQWSAAMSTGCGETRLELDDGRRVNNPIPFVPFGADMPWTEKIESFSVWGEHRVLLSNTGIIAAELARHNGDSSGTSITPSSRQSCAVNSSAPAPLRGAALLVLTLLGCARRARRTRG